MQIQGLGHVHGPQQINAPHSTYSARPAEAPRGDSLHVDQLDISPEASYISQVRDLPEIRQDRVAALRAQIASGTYETPDKMDAALSRLLDEIA
jgi:negative regulator of flagellin synthesis FlgM